MKILVVLMLVFIIQSSVYEFKKMTIRRFSFESKIEMMKINISATFKFNEFTASLDQWLFVNITNSNVNI